ncbi:MAG: cupin domain-containing protein [Rhizobiales bacterium]|nr:cupin domain-containing protein [Hyphomicrobiales bacterium]
MLKKSLVVATLAALALGGVALAQNAPVSPSPVKRTIVGKVEVPGSKYETITAIVEIAPGFKAGRHFHPGLVFAQVTEGEFWLAPDAQPEKVYKNGETLSLSEKLIHNEGNASSDKWVKLVATYVVEKGQPLVQPVK